MEVRRLRLGRPMAGRLLAECLPETAPCGCWSMVVRMRYALGESLWAHAPQTITSGNSGGRRQLLFQRRWAVDLGKGGELFVDGCWRGHVGVNPEAVAELERLARFDRARSGKIEGGAHPAVVADVKDAR